MGMVTRTGCLICGKEIVYSINDSEYVCAICGAAVRANAVCEAGHFVCDACHASAAGDFLDLIRGSEEKDPGRIFRRVIALEGVHMHGPEHHAIVACTMLVAYKNSGGVVEFESAFEAAAERGGKVPGGICGFWGACGAAIGAGIFASLVLGSSPYYEDVWGAPQVLTARCLEKIAEFGGPRCCKRTSRIAIETCVRFVSERFGIEMPLEGFRCEFSPVNAECIGGRCPYF